MSNTRVPKKLVDFVLFIVNRGPKWKTNAASIGISAGQGTSIENMAGAVQAAFDAREDAQQALEAAHNNLMDTIAQGRTMVGDLIRVIDGYAANSSDPTEVYNLAAIPAPSSPAPLPAPGLPQLLKVTLDQSGALHLSWKCPNPPGSVGVVYELKRSLNGGAAQYLGVAGTRKFVDSTLPAGSAVVGYQITAVRSTSRGPLADFTVKLGVTGGGGMAITSVTEGGMAKLAA